MANDGDNDGEASTVPDVVPARVQPSDELEYRLRQQALLAELGRRALAADDVDELLQEASRLVALRGNLQLVAAEIKGDERLARLIDAAEKGVERGEKLTNQLLAFARKQALRPQLCNVNTLLKEFDVLAGRVLGDTIELAIEPDPGIWPCEIDSTQFASALLNLVGNAGDAMPSGGKVVIRTGNVIFKGRRAAHRRCQARGLCHGVGSG